MSLVALGSRAKVSPEVFRAIFDAWQSRRCVKLTYEAVDGKVSERLVEPQALAFYEGNWYVKAVSRTKDGKNIPKAERRASALALHRIRSAEPASVKFEPDQKIIDAVNRREIFDFPLVRDIRLRLGPEARKFIGEEFDVVEEKRDGDACIVRIAAAPAYRIVNYVLVEMRGRTSLPLISGAVSTCAIKPITGAFS